MLRTVDSRSRRRTRCPRAAQTAYHRPGRGVRRIRRIRPRSGQPIAQPLRAPAVQVCGAAPVPAGDHQVRMEFTYDGGGLGKGGTATLYVDGTQVGEGRIEGTVPMSSRPTRRPTRVRHRHARQRRLPPEAALHRAHPLGADRHRRGGRGPRPPDPPEERCDSDGSAVAGATLEKAAPARQQRLDAGRADDRLAGSGSSAGASTNGRVCGPPRPPWNEISSSKAQPWSSIGS